MNLFQKIISWTIWIIYFITIIIISKNLTILPAVVGVTFIFLSFGLLMYKSLGSVNKLTWLTQKNLSRVAIILTILGTITTLVFYAEFGTKIYLLFNRDLQKAINMLFYCGHRYKSSEDETTQITSKYPAPDGKIISYNCILSKNEREFSAMERLLKDKYSGNKTKLNYGIVAIVLYQIAGDKDDNLNTDFGIRPICFVKDIGLPFDEENCLNLVSKNSHRVSEEYLLTRKLEEGINRRIVIISSVLIISGGIINIIAINLNGIKKRHRPRGKKTTQFTKSIEKEDVSKKDI